MTLKKFFRENPCVAIGFSGGVDSSYLLYAGLYYGAEVHAYFVKSPFQPEFELRDALQIVEDLKTMKRDGHLPAGIQEDFPDKEASEYGTLHFTIIQKDILENEQVCANPSDRCYYCKSSIFGTLKDQAIKDGINTILDGTNASDDASDRPGMKATAELSVRSPLRDCGLTKAQVRELSKEAGLFTWEKPSYACLATRIPTGTMITAELLQKVEASEEALFSLGFSDFRVRVMNQTAKLQLPSAQMAKLLQQRQEVLQELKQYFSNIVLDLESRSGE